MATPKFDRARAIRILVDAEALGDANACKKWKLTSQTLRNYRKRLDGDPDLLQAFAVLQREADRSWKQSRRKFLETALSRATELAKDEKNLEKLSRSIERIGNLDVASEALNVSSGVDQPSPPTPGDAGEAGSSGEPEQEEAAPAIN